MEMSLQYIKSQKGKDQLLYKGYLHTKERLIGDKTLWKCADYHKYHYCTGRAHTCKDQVIKYTPHLHPPSRRAVEAKNVACSPKKMGISSQELTRKVVVANWNVLPHAVADKKPRIQNMEQTIQRLKACLNAARHVTCDLQTSATIAETGSNDPPLLPSLMPPDCYECPDGFEDRSFTAPPVISNKTIASHSTTIQASQEAGRQRFRLGTILPGEAPQEILSRLSEAAQQWLCPCEHDKDQIVDMVILEQFLNVLPADIQTWVRAREPGSSKEVAQLAETYLREQRVVKTTQDRVTFEDVSVHFTAEEWPLLDHEEKKNYWNVMHQNYENVAWLAGDGTDSRDPWQVAPEPVVKLPEKSKEEISQSPEQDSVGKNCLERQQQNSSGEKEEKFVLSQNVLRKVVRDRDNEPALEARCICADCENRDNSPMLLTSPRCPDKEDPEPAALSGELHERFEKKGSQNSEQNLSKENSSSAQKQRPNHSGNEKNKSILFRNVLKDPVHQDGGPGQEVQCVCTDGRDQGELLTVVNNRKLPSGTDSECVVLAEGLLQNSEGISQSPEQDLEPNPMHSEVRPIEATTFMGETQNGLASQQADHSGKQEGQDKSITLENGLGEEPVGDALHLGAQPGRGTQNTNINCGGQEESSKCLSVQKSIHRDNLNTREREFTQSSDPVRQSSSSHSGKNSCGLSASIKHRRIAPKTKGVKGRNACVRLSLDPHQGIYLGGKPKNCLKRENCRRWGCSPFEPGRAPRGLQALKHEQRFPSLPLLAKTAAEPTVAQLMAVLQQLAADTAEIKSSVASLHVTISGIQNALGNLSGCTDEAEHRISDLEDTSRNTKAQLVQHCSDIKAIEAKLIGKAVQTNVIAGLWSSLSVKRGTSPLNFPPNS